MCWCLMLHTAQSTSRPLQCKFSTTRGSMKLGNNQNLSHSKSMIIHKVIIHRTFPSESLFLLNLIKNENTVFSRSLGAGGDLRRRLPHEAQCCCHCWNMWEQMKPQQTGHGFKNQDMVQFCVFSVTTTSPTLRNSLIVEG